MSCQRCKSTLEGQHGNRRYCGECKRIVHRDRQREIYGRKREERLAHQKRRYESNAAVRERKRASSQRSMRRHLLAGYGLTPDDYDRLLEAQGGTCAICDATPQTNGQALAVDHCHETGRVRGLLCGSHNRAIGAFGDDLAGVLRAVAYLAAAEEVSDALEALGSG